MSEFRGFPKGMPRFLARLKENNNKEWFEAHRKDYEAFVKQPSVEFVMALGEKLRDIAPRIKAIPKTNQSLFRINRDTRFSQDKRPYKTNIGILFLEGDRKRMECSGFYFHVEEGKLMLATGIYRFSKEILARYRDAVVDKKHGPRLRKAVKEISHQGYAVAGKHYKKTPRGYDAAHKNAEYLLYHGLHTMIEENISDGFYSDDIVNFSLSHYKKMVPLHQWLTKAVVN